MMQLSLPFVDFVSMELSLLVTFSLSYNNPDSQRKPQMSAIYVFMAFSKFVNL